MHIQVKPHHFLDYIYEMAAFQGKFDPVMATGSQYGYVGTLLAAGKIDSVTFTSGDDDACQNCCKLVEGICTDEFTTPEAIAFNKGYTRKYDYNMKMDMDFVQELPEVFSLGQVRNIDEVYALLHEKLTPEIILLNWQREKRVELTFQGLEMLIKKRECVKKEKNHED